MQRPAISPKRARFPKRSSSASRDTAAGPTTVFAIDPAGAVGQRKRPQRRRRSLPRFIERECCPPSKRNFASDEAVRPRRPVVGGDFDDVCGATRGSSFPFIVALMAGPSRRQLVAGTDDGASGEGRGAAARFVTLECRYRLDGQSVGRIASGRAKSGTSIERSWPASRTIRCGCSALISGCESCLTITRCSIARCSTAGRHFLLSIDRKDYGAAQAPPLPYLRQLLDEQMGPAGRRTRKPS